MGKKIPNDLDALEKEITRIHLRYEPREIAEEQTELIMKEVKALLFKLALVENK